MVSSHGRFGNRLGLFNKPLMGSTGQHISSARRIYTRIATGEDGSKEQRPPVRVAVFTIYYETVCSACMYILPIRRTKSPKAEFPGG